MEDSGDEGLAFEHLRGSTTLRVIIVGSGFGELISARERRGLDDVADVVSPPNLQEVCRPLWLVLEEVSQ
jgi:hypothetical protein